MKRTVKIFAVAIVALIGFATVSYAQPRAVGLNLGYGASVSYQHNLGEANFLDVAVDLPNFSGIGAHVTYDWVDPFGAKVPWNNKGSWNWYLGVGAAGGFYNLFADLGQYKGGYVGVAGHVGIAYDFWFPLQLSFDWRPNFGVGFWEEGTNFNMGGLYNGITLGVRYRF
jgi:hypothetical protein